MQCMQGAAVTQCILYAPVTLRNRLEGWSAKLQLQGSTSAILAPPAATVPYHTAQLPASGPSTAELILQRGDVTATGKLVALSQPGMQLVVLQTAGELRSFHAMLWDRQSFSDAQRDTALLATRTASGGQQHYVSVSMTERLPASPICICAGRAIGG